MLLYIPKQLLIILNAEIVQQTPFNSDNNNTNNYNIVRLQRRLFLLVFFFFLCLAQTKPKTIPHITHNFLHSSETLYYMPLNVSRLIPSHPIPSPLTILHHSPSPCVIITKSGISRSKHKSTTFRPIRTHFPRPFIRCLRLPTSSVAYALSIVVVNYYYSLIHDYNLFATIIIDFFAYSQQNTPFKPLKDATPPQELWLVATREI